MQRITIFAITLMSVIFILSIVLILLERAYHLELPLQKNSINSYCQSNKYKKVERKGYLSDKYQVKKYINKNYEYIKTAKVLLYSKDLEEIKNFNYPADFVLKSSAGSRMFLIVENGEYKINNLVNKSKEFMNIDFANFGYRRIPFFGFEEPQYNHNKKAIMVEEHLGDVKEFRIMVINGKILYYDIPEEGFFGNDYQKINIKSDDNDYKAEGEMNKPKKLELMEKFVQEFYEKEKIELTRCDFLLQGDEVYFGEVTFTPCNCFDRYNTSFNKHTYLNYIKPYKNRTD